MKYCGLIIFCLSIGRFVYAEKPSLAGYWKSNCSPPYDNRASGQIDELVMNANGQGEFTYSNFLDSECKVPAVSARIKSEVEIGEKDEALSKTYGFPVYPINTKNLRYTIRLYRQEYADSANKINYCGISDWKIEKDFDQTDLDCGKKSYNSGHMIYRYIGFWKPDRIHISISKPRGEVGDGRTPDNRSKEFDVERVLILRSAPKIKWSR